MLNELSGQSAKCPRCGYTYDGKYEMHRQEVQAIQEDGFCTWCYAFDVETNSVPEAVTTF